MIMTNKNGKRVYIITDQDIRSNAYDEQRLRDDIMRYHNFIMDNPNCTAKQRKCVFDKVVNRVSYCTQMVEYVEAGMENTNWVGLLTTVITLMDKELAKLDMSDYDERIMIAHPWQWVRGNIVKKRDQCEAHYKTTQKYLREVMRSTFLNGCANQNSGSTNLRLIGAPHAYGPIRKHIAQYVGAVDA